MSVETRDRFSRLRGALDARDGEARLRDLNHFEPLIGTPFVKVDGAELLNFSSNDYLGLAGDPEVIEAAVGATRQYGAGAGASRLVTGGLEIHRELEEELAELAHRPSALLFNSGFQANATIVPALMDRDGLVVCDRHSHASILHGCRAERTRFRRFRHNDPEHLDWTLTRHGRGAPTLVVTESVFSMDGDRAPLEEICQVADRHDSLLMVDDAHAIGVFGGAGEGLASPHPRVDLVLGTFGKAFGVGGAFIACDTVLRSHLVNFCRGFIYTTAPPPPLVGAVQAALAKIRSGDLDRPRYLELVAGAHRRLRAAGFETSPSDTQIVPVRCGDDESALAWATDLKARGLLVVPIRPPTVPEGTARIRVSLTRLHTSGHLDRLLDGLRSLTPVDGP